MNKQELTIYVKEFLHFINEKHILNEYVQKSQKNGKYNSIEELINKIININENNEKYDKPFIFFSHMFFTSFEDEPFVLGNNKREEYSIWLNILFEYIEYNITQNDIKNKILYKK